MSEKPKVTTYDPGTQVVRDDVLCLHRNENLFIEPSWSVDAARELIEEARIACYPDPQCTELRAVLAALYGVKVGNVFMGNGADEVLSDVLGLLRQRYDDLWLVDVCFKVYPMLADRFGYRTRVIPGKTFETGEVAVDGWQGRLALVDSPNAITGLALASGSLDLLAADETSFLIWDNVYGELAMDELPREIPDNVVIVRSFSKFYGLAGLRIGYALASEPVVDELLARKDVFNVNCLAQRMAREALRRRDEFERLADDIRRCREDLVSRLESLDFVLHQPSSTHYVLVSHPAVDAETLRLRLLERDIAVRHFAGAVTGNHVRITVPPPPGIARLMDALGGIIEEETHSVKLAAGAW